MVLFTLIGCAHDPQGEALNSEIAAPAETPTSAGTPAGTVTGNVIDENGLVLQYASVLVLGARTGGQTDAKGHFRLIKVPIGTHTVRVRMIGYVAQEREVQVTEGDTTNVDFVLNEVAVNMAH